MQNIYKIHGREYRTEDIPLLRQHENEFISRDLADFLEDWFSESPVLAVQTSGSTGTPKIMHAEKTRMKASAEMTCSFLGLQKNNTALLCMPLKFIGAKMLVVRSLLYGLDLYCVKPSEHPLKNFPFAPDFLAMTPAQVHASLQNPSEAEKLKNTKHLIIGGGAINKELADALRDFPNHVWSTYGMTETLSHIALRRLNGEKRSEWYQPFDGVKVSLSEKQTLVIEAFSVCKDVLTTNDIAEIDDTGRFKIIGRSDNVINSGGIKIHAEELEEKLSAVMDRNFQISSVPDSHFGEAVVILIENGKEEDKERYRQKFRQTLHPHFCPKHIVFVDKIPKTETDKPNRAKAKEIALRLMNG